MLSKKLEKAINDQIAAEAYSSQFYLAMASWAETQGLGGVAGFMYGHADEERIHMLKFMKFLNERGAHALVSNLKAPPATYKSMQDLFNKLLKHETGVTKSINELVHMCLEEKDYTTHNFMQWFVAEQIEEEALARTILDKIKMIGSDSGGLYLFDRDIENIAVQSASAGQN